MTTNTTTQPQLFEGPAELRQPTIYVTVVHGEPATPQFYEVVHRTRTTLLLRHIGAAIVEDVSPNTALITARPGTQYGDTTRCKLHDDGHVRINYETAVPWDGTPAISRW